MVNVYKYFTSNTTFTVPSGINSLTMAVTGAGGGGGAHTQYRIHYNGGGGGAGGYVKATAQVSPGQKLSIVVGAAGAGGGISGENGLPGGTGGASSISGYITCNGGTPGYGRSGNYAGGKGGTCSYTTSKLSGINYVKGGDGAPGNYDDIDPNCYTYTKGGASAHGMNNRRTSPTYGAGGYGGSGSVFGSLGRGRPGGAGLVQLWYKMDIRNMTF